MHALHFSRHLQQYIYIVDSQFDDSVHTNIYMHIEAKKIFYYELFRAEKLFLKQFVNPIWKRH